MQTLVESETSIASYAIKNSYDFDVSLLIFRSRLLQDPVVF